MVLASHLNLLHCGAASLSPSEHPNEMKFRGILVRLDEPSDKAPNGSEGHPIMVPTSVAKRRLKTLVGMGLNYSRELTGHAQRHKVGVIKRAWIDGKNLCVEGVIWKHDFPEVEKDLKQPGLGMSMELGDVSVEDQSSKVWTLNDFVFLGATILWRRSAAYHKTQAIAAQADERSTMKTQQKKKTAAGTGGSDKKVVELAASAAASAVVNELKPTLTGFARAINTLTSRLDSMEVERIAASAAVTASEDEEEEVEVNASEEDQDTEDVVEISAGKKDDDGDEDEDEDDDEDEDEMESAIDKDGLEDMGPKTGEDADDDDTPGNLNKGAKNKGDKTSSENTVGKHVSDGGVTGSAYRRQVKLNKQLAAQVAAANARIAKLEKQIKASAKQMKASAELQSRRSLSIVASSDPMLRNTMAKAGVDLDEVQASGQPLTIEQVDQVLATGMPDASPVDRMAFKNKLVQAGLMVHGGVVR